MASDYSFDVVSKVDMPEVKNAVTHASKELAQRYDFKGSKSSIELNDEEITIISDDEYKLQAVLDILKTKLIKRGVPIKSLDYNKLENAANSTVRQLIKIIQGIDKEVAKDISKKIKKVKFKAQVQIQGDQLRISSKSKDSLQEVMQFLKELDLDVELQFENYR